MSANQTLGSRGEALAAQHLQQRGYRILETNWRCRVGELDIIAQQGETLVFVEVRTRRAHSTEEAFASVTADKQERFLRAVQIYLNTQATEEVDWRMDVIGIALPRHSAPIIEHVEDALDW